MTKLISWNVNGLRACVGKGFLDFFREADANVFCIQESKLQEGQIELDLPGYHQYRNPCPCPMASAWRNTIRRDG